MKPIFKNSAIAILVALGLSGCLITDSGDSTASTEKTPINPSTAGGSSSSTDNNSDSTDTGSSSTDNNSDSTGTGSSPTDSNSGSTDTGSSSTDSNSGSTGIGSSSTDSNSASTGTDSSSTDSNSDSTGSDSNSSSTQTEQPAIAAKTDKNGEAWRHIRLARGHFDGGNSGYDALGKSETTTYKALTGGVYNWAGVDDTSDNYYLDLGADNFQQDSIYINTGELSDELKVNLIYYSDDSHTIGAHDPDTPSHVYKELENPIKYAFVNQPYSSYGFLYSETVSGDGSKGFYLGQSAATEGSENYSKAEYNVGKYDPATKEITWNDNIVGSATYRANVIRLDDPQMFDGVLILNANFVNGVKKSTFSAELDSRTIGKVDIIKDAWSSGISEDGYFRTYSSRDGEIKTMHGQFVGKDFNDVVGKIGIVSPSLSGIGYHAVFGGTKQK